MTAKDLNLNTDPNQLAAWAQQNALTAPPPTQTSGQRNPRPRADLAAVPTNKPRRKEPLAAKPAPVPVSPQASTRSKQNKKATSPKGSGKHGGRQWLLTALIAVVNMLFIGLAALWLTGTDLQGRLTPDAATQANTETLILAVQESNVRLASVVLELGAVKEQLKVLENRMQTAQPSPKPAAQANISETITQPAATVETATAAKTETTEAATEAATTQKQAAAAPAPAKPRAWQVNLGDYSSRKEARATQRILQKMGLEAQISQLQANGSTAYLVSVSGFADRKDAEDVANDIMVETLLNGLWVAKTP